MRDPLAVAYMKDMAVSGVIPNRVLARQMACIYRKAYDHYIRTGRIRRYTYTEKPTFPLSEAMKAHLDGWFKDLHKRIMANALR